MIAIIAVFCCALSVQGVTGLIDYVTPLFAFIYPIFIVLTALGLFDKYIANDGIYKGVLVASVFGLMDAFVIVTKSEMLDSVMKSLPFRWRCFAWVLPTVFGVVIGYFIYRNKPRAEELV